MITCQIVKHIIIIIIFSVAEPRFRHRAMNKTCILIGNCTKILDVCKSCAGNIMKYIQWLWEIPNWSNRGLGWAKVSQNWLKGDWKIAKGSQKGVKREPKDGKSRPKRIQKSMAKNRSPKWCLQVPCIISFWESFWDHFLLKISFENQCKSRCRKGMTTVSNQIDPVPT